MKLSPQMEAQFAENRLKKLQNEASRKKCFWAFLILGCIVFFTAFFAGARSSMLDNAHGPAMFYTAMAAGIFQILFGIFSIVTGVLNYRGSRVGGLICIGICLLLLFYFIIHSEQSFAVADIIFILTALVLSGWAQMIFHREEELSQQPGYPLFSPEASFAAVYELPLNVRAAKAAASQDMATVGPLAEPEQETAAAADALFRDNQPVSESAFSGGKEIRLPQEVKVPEVRFQSFLNPEPAPAPAPAVTPEEQLMDMTAVPAHAVQKGNAALLPDPAEIQAQIQAAKQAQAKAIADAKLESFAKAEGGVRETGVDALPKVSAEELLMDMTAVPSHAVKKGDVSQLPDPAEVRERMAAMKRARQEYEAAMKQARLDHPRI